MTKNSLFREIQALKNQSGTHSPSIDTIKELLPPGHIKVDACFLSNPYATELFMEYFDKELLNDKKRLRDLLEFYPPQNNDIGKKMSKFLKIDEQNIVIGNGAIELIQAILHNFVKEKLSVPIPTFSSYYEFVKSDTKVEYYQLHESNNFQINLDDYAEWILKNEISDVVLINPNNPNGSYVGSDELLAFLDKLKSINSVILDESFIHFAYENSDLTLIDSHNFVTDFPNLILVKSMSKDFGIAGIRCGYALMSANRIKKLLSNGYLWNSNGLSSYFFDLYTQVEFQSKYEIVRKKYIMNALMFQAELKSVKNITIYPTKANFTLIKLNKGTSSFDVMVKLLVDYGVYVRECSDKMGLNGNFIRVACRSFEENQIILNALKSL